MITFSIFSIIWGIISYFNIRKACSKNLSEFNPFEGGFINYLGFVFGIVMLIGWFVFIIFTSFP